MESRAAQGGDLISGDMNQFREESELISITRADFSCLLLIYINARQLSFYQQADSQRSLFRNILSFWLSIFKAEKS